MFEQLTKLAHPEDLDRALATAKTRFEGGKGVEAGKTLVAISEKADGTEDPGHRNFFASCAFFGAGLLLAYSDDPPIIVPTAPQAGLR